MSQTTPVHARPWALEIFKMTSRRRQERSLQAFDRPGMPGVHALGVVRDDDWFMVVDATSIADQIRSRRVIMNVDPGATRMHSASHRRHRDELGSWPDAPVDNVVSGEFPTACPSEV